MKKIILVICLVVTTLVGLGLWFFKNTDTKPKKINTVALVEMYTQNGCSWCTKAKTFLRTRGIPFKEYVIDKHNIKDVLNYIKIQTVPKIFINEQDIGGYDDLVKLEKSGKLEQILQEVPSN